MQKKGAKPRSSKKKLILDKSQVKYLGARKAGDVREGDVLMKKGSPQYPQNPR